MSILSDQLEKFLPEAGDDLCENLKKAAQFELEWIKFLKVIFLDADNFTDEFKEAYCALGCAEDGGGAGSTTSTTSTTTPATSPPGTMVYSGGGGLGYACDVPPAPSWLDFDFTVPIGKTSIHAKVWGGGGAGGQSYPFLSGGGGGGGGEYRECDIVVVPGEVLNIRVSTGGAIRVLCVLVNGVYLPYAYIAGNAWQSTIFRGSTILVNSIGGAFGGPGTSGSEGVGGAGGTGGSFGVGTSGTSASSGLSGEDAVDCVGGDGGESGSAFPYNGNQNIGHGGRGAGCAGSPANVAHAGEQGASGRIEVSWS